MTKNIYAEYQYQINKLRKENKQLEFNCKSLAVIAYNAIVFGKLDEEHDKHALMDELGITKEEWELIMGNENEK